VGQALSPVNQRIGTQVNRIGPQSGRNKTNLMGLSPWIAGRGQTSIPKLDALYQSNAVDLAITRFAGAQWDRRFRLSIKGSAPK